MKLGAIVPQGWTGEYDGWGTRDAWRRLEHLANGLVRLLEDRRTALEAARAQLPLVELVRGQGTREEEIGKACRFVTAINKETCYVHKGYEAGGIDYILKPFDPKEMLACIRRALSETDK